MNVISEEGEGGMEGIANEVARLREGHITKEGSNKSGAAAAPDVAADAAAAAADRARAGCVVCYSLAVQFAHAQKRALAHALGFLGDICRRRAETPSPGVTETVFD